MIFLIIPTYNWQFAPQVEDADFTKMAKKAGLGPEVARLLFERGIKDETSLKKFLEPSLEDLHDPYLLHDMEKAVERIRHAIEQGELILIYGDYDADGMTSASIVKESLEQIGAECLVYLPNRFTDGYGPNASVYKYFIEQQGVSLIVTVDNGVAGHEAIDLAQSMGVDVIVTDHHSMPEVLPDAYAIIHPEHPGADYPFKHLAGCGVAFKLACALLEEVQVELLDLVAIGTIADMVSLTDENRIMVQYGLEVLRNTQRMGLQEMFEIAGISSSDVTEETVGFQLAPRLNALGRLDDPNPAIDLLTGFDDEEVHEIALLIHQKNEERKEVVQSIYDEAKDMVDPERSVQVLAKEGWNPGVLGIVAGRLLEELGQTVIVLNIEDGRAKGSARSIEAVDIFEALDADFFCLQETKMQEGQADVDLPGYHQYFSYAEKKGYSGTAIFTKHEPLSVTYNFEGHEDEGRAVLLEYDKFYLLNVYVPNAQPELKRLEYRMQWEDDLRAMVSELAKKKHVVMCGDLNVAHEEIDLKNPKTNRKNAGFTDEEREKMTQLLSNGFIDTFRTLYPEQVTYSWWSYRFRAREKNTGWRIDYFLISERLKDRLEDAKIHTEIMGSDHCPVEIILK